MAARAQPGSIPLPRRGRTRRLSRERIVNAALMVIDEDGMAAVTMRGIATRLEVEAMSLYKHIDNRDALFDAVVARIVGELSEEAALSCSDGWKRYLADLARGIRRYARAHPQAFPLVATRPTQAPWINPPLRSLDWIEALLRTLHEQGFSDAEVIFAYRTFNAYLLGALLLETSAMAIHDRLPGEASYPPTGPESSDEHPPPVVPATSTAAGAPAELGRHALHSDQLDRRAEIDAYRHPTVHRLADGLAEDHFDSGFEAGLLAMLDQIEHHLLTH